MRPMTPNNKPLYDRHLVYIYCTVVAALVGKQQGR
jgi:hypothetical protein